MRINKGYTLAEVLITLSIIGVVATMTIPTLNVNVQKAQAGPSVMKALNTLQNALSLGMTQKGLRNLNSFEMTKLVFDKYEDKNNPGKKIEGPLYSTLNNFDAKNETVQYYNYDNTSLDSLSSAIRIYTTKDGIDFILPNKGENAVDEVSSDKDNGKQGFVVYIDVNGYSKAPNKLGKDTFKFIVSTRGFVIPYGGYEYSKNFTEDTTPLWEDNCNSKEIVDGETCTGSIVDNGGKVVYKY